VLGTFVYKLRHSATKVYFTGTRPNISGTLRSAQLREPLVEYAATIEDAKRRWHLEPTGAH
jgi:hypothetical protein